MKRADRIDKNILEYMADQKMASTREIALAVELAWHTANTHCLKLQIAGKLEGIKIGNMNVWKIKRVKKGKEENKI